VHSVPFPLTGTAAVLLARERCLCWTRAARAALYTARD
jgi:hypothetical protein